MRSIAVGIVLYNPSIYRLEQSISSISKQSDILLIVDNASKNISEIEKCLKQTEIHIKLIKNTKNEGIAKALNQLCGMSICDGYNWILTLDQDSVCPTNMLVEYEKILLSEEFRDAGILCPTIKDINYGYLNKHTDKIEKIADCITSGSLINLSIWSQVDGFDEKMFIDGVDFDYCNRIIEKGNSIYRLNNIVLEHEIGHIEIRHFLWINVLVKNHSASRKYYIARNTIYVARKRNRAVYRIKSHLQIIKLLIVTLIYETDKKNKLYQILKGWYDGVNDCSYKKSRE